MSSSNKNSKTTIQLLLNNINNKKNLITVAISLLLVIGITLGSKFEKREISAGTNTEQTRRKINKIDKNKSKNDDVGKNENKNNAGENNTTENSGSSNDTERYKDGEYTGKAKGYNGDIKVSVKIKNGKISTIDILESNDDKEYLNSAKGVINEIIKAQSTNVDSISGATYSSNGILDAVQSALDSGV